MIKNILKLIFSKIYQIGKFEAEKRVLKERLNQLCATISPEASINEIIIYNNQNDKNKIVVGKKSQIRGELLLFSQGGEIIIGENTYIGPGTKLWSANKISVGNRVLISYNVNIHDNNSHSLKAEDRHQEYLYIFNNFKLPMGIDLKAEQIIIEDDAWIGFNSTILKGVTIGRGAIIGANTVITHNVPPFAVVVGNPPRIIKYSN
jgi:acetyltransferase-like isoleucine patch superfamily enzyme